MKADEILKKYEDANEMHFHEVDRKWIIEAMEEYAALRQPPVSGSLPSVDPLDYENSEIHKIGREIAEMSDEEFEANCKALEKMLKGSKGNDR